jgi:hypothetical protein
MQSQIGLNNVQGGGGVDIGAMAQQALAYLTKLDPATKQAEMQRLSQENPQIFQLVMSMMQGQGGPPQAPQVPGQQGMQPQQPLPEQRPPRRQGMA